MVTLTNVQNLAVDGRYWQATVFLVDSTQSGSWGLILNRPSGYTVEKVIFSGEILLFRIPQRIPKFSGFLTEWNYCR